MLKHTRAVYATCKSGVSGGTYNKKRKRWEAYITFQQIDHYLGSYKTKQGAIEARIEGEKVLRLIYQQREKFKMIKQQIPLTSFRLPKISINVVFDCIFGK